MAEQGLNNINDIAVDNAYLEHLSIPMFWQSKVQVKSKQISEINESSKLAPEDLAVQKKLEVLVLVEKLDSVSAASRQSDVSRYTICHHRRLVKRAVPDALKRQETPNICSS